MLYIILIARRKYRCHRRQVGAAKADLVLTRVRVVVVQVRYNTVINTQQISITFDSPMHLK